MLLVKGTQICTTNTTNASNFSVGMFSTKFVLFCVLQDKTALNIATEKGHTDIVRILIDNGADKKFHYSVSTATHDLLSEL